MNQNVASYPSVLGVPDCIEERVSFDASLAQVVGSSARWSSYESRYQSGIVTGSAFLTPDLRAWRESHESTFVSLALGRAFRCTLTQWEPRADSQGRAIVSYASLLVETYYLPRPDALVCLYVPRWQTVQGGDVIEDMSGNDYHLIRNKGALTWNAGGIDMSATANITTTITTRAIGDYTIVAHHGGLRTNNYYTGLGLNMDSTTVLRCELKRPSGYMAVSLGGSVTTITPPTDGAIYMRRSDYCGQRVNVGSQREYNVINVGRGSASNGCLWLSMQYVALWSVSLTDAQIVAAERYLSQLTRPS